MRAGWCLCLWSLNQGTWSVCKRARSMQDGGSSSQVNASSISRKDVSGDHVRLFVSHFQGV